MTEHDKDNSQELPDEAEETRGRPNKLKLDDSTLRQIRSLSMIKTTKDEAAAVLGVHRATLYRFMADHPEAKVAWDDGFLASNVSLRRKQWKLADKSAGMAIFLGKNYLGQDDRQDLRLSGSEGGPIEVISTDMTPAQAAAAYAASIDKD